MHSPADALVRSLLQRCLLTIGNLGRRLEPVMRRIPRRVLRLIFVLGAVAFVVAVALRSRSLLAPLAHVTNPQLV